MSPSRNCVRVAATLATISLLAASCGGNDAGITLYSGRGEKLIQPIIDEFEEASGISVEVKFGKSADLALLIDEEGEAGEIAADVFLSQSPGSMGFLEERSRLGVVPDSTLALVPDNVRDDGGSWVGFSGRQRVLVYNTDAVDPADLPSSVFDMTNPQWKGRVGVAPANGSFQDFVTAMRATQGDTNTLEWLKALDANDPVLYANNNSIVAAVGRGEVDTGLVNHYYNYRALAENPDQPSANHVFAADDPGAVLIITGAAILADADDVEPAAQLIDFLLGSSGQQYFATKTFEYPLAIGESPANNVPPINFSSDVSNAGGIAFEDLAGGLEATRALIAESGLES
ncbi:extracellular solute-binding protein [uncultured Ilumatobacter sp.]|uniref:extracellular solute-binding protein n=1 Tax=uncultured Ilumatobacter sp. TaxID=879968 RepID=UPI00374F031C|tara:strand:- start:43 stop:1074 length:1032 start_codon:yes stop_codon:yes gene_type:complete